MRCVQLRITNKFAIANQDTLVILVYDVKLSISVEMHHVVPALNVKTVKVLSNVLVAVV